MSTVEEQLQKKKPFKKKTYRSYLSLDETLDDILNSDERDEPNVTNSPQVTSSPQVIKEPMVIFSPEASANVGNPGKSIGLKAEPQVTSSPQVIKVPMVIFSPEDSGIEGSPDKSMGLKAEPQVTSSPQVIKEPVVKFSPEDNATESTLGTSIASKAAPQVTNSPKVINAPMVIFSPEDSAIESTLSRPIDLMAKPQVTNSPKVINEPMVIFSPESKPSPLTPSDQKNSIIAPEVTKPPQVIFSPEDQLFEDVPSKHEHQNLESPNRLKKNITGQENSNSDSNQIHQHAAMDNFNLHNNQLNKGFTRVPNSILQVLISGDLTKHELQTLAVILRMTIGFNKEEAPISIGVIQNWTGIQSSRISAALNVLIEKKLISRKSGTINTPNLISIIFSDEQSKVNLSSKVQISPMVSIEPKVKIEPVSSGENLTVHLGLENHLQYIQQKQKDSLSAVSTILTNIIQPMMNKEKERVFNLFKELRVYPIEDIEAVFLDVFNNKLDTIGNTIKSEIGYLETCFLKHKNWLEGKRLSKHKELSNKLKVETNKRLEDDQTLQEESEWRNITFAFTSFFKTEKEQMEAIEMYSKDLKGPYANMPPAKRNFAIKAWHSQTQAD